MPARKVPAVAILYTFQNLHTPLGVFAGLCLLGPAS
jgi:hypothetical protein